MRETWTLGLTLGKVREFRTRLGLDLLNPQHHLQVLNSLTDRLAFVFLLCEEQAKQTEVSVDEFEERLIGDGFADAASDAFLAELAFFFPQPGPSGDGDTDGKIDPDDEGGPGAESRIDRDWAACFDVRRRNRKDPDGIANRRWRWVAEMGAVAGLDPMPWTLRELCHAANMKRLHDYDIASGIRSTIANAFGSTPRQPHEFNPLRDERGKCRFST